MKKIKITLIGVAVLVIILTHSISGSAATREGELPVTGKYKNLFVFKADRNFVGGKVEVLYSNGDVVTAQTLQKRKMIIDFGDVKHGSYTIRISKGDRVKEFQYNKN
jgi:hypothetical protein